MYLSTITLKNFRKYAYDGVSKHGITVNFHKGLNALIGENDSGKSAIIDAIKAEKFLEKSETHLLNF